MIQPEVRDFEFPEFSRLQGMFNIVALARLEVLPQLKPWLSRGDHQQFWGSAEEPMGNHNGQQAFQYPDE